MTSMCMTALLCIAWITRSFHEISHIFRGSALWKHAKFAFKKRDRRLTYKQIYNHLFERNTLGNRKAACEIKIGHLE